MLNLEILPTQLDCATNRTENLRTISGALVLTAIQESFANNSFTSATVITRQSFDLSRSNLTFEVRAALPSSDILSGHILLITEEDFKIEGKVILLLNLRNSIKSGYHYLTGNSELVRIPESPKLIDEFNIYRIDIRKGSSSLYSSWSSNGTLISPSSHSVITRCRDRLCGNLLAKAKFKLAITLEVANILDGGNTQEVFEKSKKWWCSSMIIDYIRVYDSSNTEFSELPRVNITTERASTICDEISENIGRKHQSYIQITDKIIMFLAILLVVILVSSLTAIILMSKKVSQVNERVRIENLYADNYEKDEDYVDYNSNGFYNNYGTYDSLSSHYQVIGDEPEYLGIME